MSDIFESDIEEDVNLNSLEDNDTSDDSSDRIDFDKPLLQLRLEYSSESLYAKPNDKLELNPGDYVICNTRYGNDMVKFAGLAKKPMSVKASEIVNIDRKASEEDLKRRAEIAEKEKEASKVFKEKVETHKLDMKLITVHFLFEEQKALFFFTAEDRVDFRELVKALVPELRTRIEMLQVGPREHAKVIGGVGVCGRPFCCHEFMTCFDQVPVKTAKDQGLTNPTKHSGSCGKLACRESSCTKGHTDHTGDRLVFKDEPGPPDGTHCLRQNLLDGQRQQRAAHHL